MDDYQKHMVYFKIVGNFNVDKLLHLLDGVPIDDTIQKGAPRQINPASKYDFSSIRVGRTYFSQEEFITTESALTQLFGKQDALNEIRKTFDVAFWLQIVPYVYDCFPVIEFGQKVIDFCSYTKTEISIDGYYLGPVEERKDEYRG